MQQTAINPGAYIGYIASDDAQQPTLFFEHGHYIQEHFDPDNIGWHAKTGTDYRGANVSVIAFQRYTTALEIYCQYGSTEEMDAFLKDFKDGKLDDNQSSERLFFESFGGKTYMFGGRLVKATDKDFNAKYDGNYAKGIMAKAQLAKNEIQSPEAVTHKS